MVDEPSARTTSTADRPARRSSTRERILDAALDLFTGEGFSATTISDVERRVGLAAGTGSFYRHFPSKDALLGAVVEREVARFTVETAEHEPFSGVDDPHAARVATMQRMLRGIRRFDHLFRLVMAEGHRVPGLRETIATALEDLWEPVSWDEHPDVVMLLSALGGYHLFGHLQARPFLEVSDDEFIDALASSMDGWTPPRRAHTGRSRGEPAR